MPEKIYKIVFICNFNCKHLVSCSFVSNALNNVTRADLNEINQFHNLNDDNAPQLRCDSYNKGLCSSW